MRTRRADETPRPRALLVALTTATTCCCLLVAAGATLAASPGAPATANPSAQITTSSSPSVIGGLLREQLTRRGDQTPQATTMPAGALTTRTAAAYPQTTTTTSETKVPSSPASTNAAPLTPTTTTTGATSTATTQPQKPASQPLAQQPATTASSAAATTTATATTTSQFQYVRPQVSSSSRPAQVATTTQQQQQQQTSQPQVATQATPTSPSPPAQAPTCQHNNRTFAIGQSWNDDCIQVCECVSSDPGNLGALAISACKPRCPVYKDTPGETCRLVRSKLDECCLEWACELEAKFAPPTATGGSAASTTTTTTVMHTELGQLNMSTTEIRMPTTTSTTVAPTCKSGPARGSQAAATVRPSSSVPPATTTTATQQPPPRRANKPGQLTPVTTSSQRAAPPTTTVVAPASTKRPLVPAAAASASGAREPKQRPLVSDMTRSVSPDQWPVVDYEAISDPTKLDLCIAPSQDLAAWKVNTLWAIEVCNQTCRCVFRNEPLNKDTDVLTYPTHNAKPGSLATEIRCGLPERCAAEQAAAADCIASGRRLRISPEPDMSHCECPRIACVAPEVPAAPAPTTAAATQFLRPSSTTTTTTTTSTTVAPTQGEGATQCRLPSGKSLARGETFNDECHSICRCDPADGQIRCEPLNCPSKPPSDHLCVDRGPASDEPEFRPNPAENKCCPEFVCRVPVLAVNGSELAAAAAAAAPAPKSQPLSCTLLGKEFAHGERLPEEIAPRTSETADGPLAASDTCEKVCTCREGKIECRPACVALDETPPADFECPPGLAYQIVEECCPRWACQENYSLQDIQVNPVNGTTVEIVVKLPEFAVGQRGKLELNFTNLPLTNADSLNEEPPAYATWVKRPSIRTYDGVFSSRLIKYYLAGLRPAHRYWLRLLVRFEAAPGLGERVPFADTPIESAIQTFVMPAAGGERDELDEPRPSSGAPLPPVVTTTTTATTTTAASTTSTTTQQPSTTRMPTQTITPASMRTTRVPLTPSSSSSSASADSRPPSATPTSTSSSISSSTTTTTTTATPPTSDLEGATQQVFTKPPVSDSSSSSPSTPCAKSPTQALDTNQIDDSTGRSQFSRDDPKLPWYDNLTQQVHNAPIQRYAWHLLVAFSVMTILFTIVSYLYLKKTTRMIAPITSPYGHHYGHHNNHHHLHGFHQQSAYDNPTFTTKLVSYNASQPRVLLVDESYQNLDNLAKQKNMEVDKSSPLHHKSGNNNNNNNGNHNNNNHTTTQVTHQNGGQRLI